MRFQDVFKRYELKYIMSQEQKESVLRLIEPYMEIDDYGRTTIRNIYFDTADYRIIRNSIERPIYKEKLRLRSYERVAPDGDVFVELKKKYNHIVYKRRLCLPEKTSMRWLNGEGMLFKPTQISNEINYFLRFYQTLMPAVFLSYEREAYRTRCGDEFRLTFDDNILYRQEQISLQSDASFGIPILESGKVLMELKCFGAIPIWMADILSKECLYRTSYSKYSTAYQSILCNTTKNLHEVIINA